MILTGSPRRLLALASSAALTLAACGGDDTGSASSDAPVVATTSIWADVTSNVGCGAEVPALIPAGADPHSFEPSLQDRELVDGATTVIANGLDLEEPILPLLDVAADNGTNVIELAIDVDVLMPTDEHDHDDEDHDDEDHDEEEGQVDDDHGHAHGDGGDPHFWQDPRRVSGTLDTIATALAANSIDTCVDEYRAELESLDAEIESMLAPIPDDARVLVTSHESLAYFADRYGFEIVGTVIPSMSTMAETNAADLAELSDEIERHGVEVIFTEEMSSAADAEALADRLGVAVVPLVTDSLTDDPDTDTYVEMMRHNAGLIAEQLVP
ncbi:MAG: zinc ABC transporter substrate-binding protein [Ilumatobacter sp.]|nr:zinc ABC transporter substrate-binding protein [Ilumatobacter sp.]